MLDKIETDLIGFIVNSPIRRGPTHPKCHIIILDPYIQQGLADEIPALGGVPRQDLPDSLS